MPQAFQLSWVGSNHEHSALQMAWWVCLSDVRAAASTSICIYYTRSQVSHVPVNQHHLLDCSGNRLFKCKDHHLQRHRIQQNISLWRSPDENWQFWLCNRGTVGSSWNYSQQVGWSICFVFWMAPLRILIVRPSTSLFQFIIYVFGIVLYDCILQKLPFSHSQDQIIFMLGQRHDSSKY